jgi:hypothetical protein
MTYIYVDSRGVVSDLDPDLVSPVEAAKRGLRRVRRDPTLAEEDAAYNALVDAAIAEHERLTILPRHVRELLLALGTQAGMANDTAFKKLKATDNTVAALRAKRKK